MVGRGLWHHRRRQCCTIIRPRDTNADADTRAFPLPFSNADARAEADTHANASPIAFADADPHSDSGPQPDSYSHRSDQRVGESQCRCQRSGRIAFCSEFAKF
jgi:hypothetical protein